MFRQLFYLVLLMITSTFRLLSQYYYYNDKYYNTLTVIETGFSIGGMNCLTDLGGKKGNGRPFLKDINWQNTHLSGGLFICFLYDQTLGIRAEVNFGEISGADRVLKNDHSSAQNRYKRNLHFKTNISELSILAEFLPMAILNHESYPLIAPYLLGGIGVFKYNPRAELNSQWIDLHPLHTEGQGFKEYPEREPYNLTQINFPIGIGIRYEISALISTRLEVVYRFLKTDYLDDVSTQYIDPLIFYSNLTSSDAFIAERLADRGSELQAGFFKHRGEIRGNPENRDSYFSFNLKLGLVLNRKRR